jgi:hypothetical protein
MATSREESKAYRKHGSASNTIAPFTCFGWLEHVQLHLLSKMGTTEIAGLEQF